MSSSPSSWLNSAETKVYASTDSETHDFFGWSVSIFDGSAIIGSFGGTGSTQIWDREGKEKWSRNTLLIPSESLQDHLFGYSVAINEMTAIVGCPLIRSNGFSYIFNRNRRSGRWSQSAILSATDQSSSVNDFYGGSVSVYGDIVAISAYKSDQIGAVYVYTVKSNGMWFLTQKLVGKDSSLYDYFGRSVSLSLSSLLVGAHCDDDFAHNSGSAYIFVTPNDGMSWTQEAKLLADDAYFADNFGESVSLFGDTALIGAKYSEKDRSAYSETGAAYVFVRHGVLDASGLGLWSQQTKLYSDTSSPYASFGASVSIAENTALIGALTEFSNITGSNQASGCAFVFERAVSGGDIAHWHWSQQARLEPDLGSFGDYFGKAVAIDASATLAVIGAYGDDKYGASSGAAYIYEQKIAGYASTTFTQEFVHIFSLVMGAAIAAMLLVSIAGRLLYFVIDRCRGNTHEPIRRRLPPSKRKNRTRTLQSSPSNISALSFHSQQSVSTLAIVLRYSF